MIKPSILLEKNVRRLLKERGWSQNDLADKIGMKSSQINRYLTGKTVPGIDVLFKFAQAFAIPAYDLLFDPEVDKPKLTPEDYKHFYELSVAVDKLKKENELLKVQVKSYPPPYDQNVLTVVSGEPALIPQDIVERISKLPDYKRKIILNTISTQLGALEGESKGSKANSG